MSYEGNSMSTNEYTSLLKNVGGNNSDIPLSQINDNVHPDNRNIQESLPNGQPGCSLENCKTYLKRFFDECLGVCVYVFIGTMSVQDTKGLPLRTGGSAVAVAIGHGMTIFILMLALGKHSGGHFNPAVTLAFFLHKRNIDVVPLLVGYIVSQFVGGIAGAFFTWIVLPDEVYHNISGGAHVLASSEEVAQALGCELALTAVLVLTFLSVAVEWDTETLAAPLAMGCVVTVDILAGIYVTGASMNPARSFGPALIINKPAVWKHHYVYWVGPLFGAVLAFLIHRYLAFVYFIYPLQKAGREFPSFKF